MRIGILCHAGVGGSVRVAVELAKALAARGHELHVIARATPPGLTPPPHGVTVHTLEAGGTRSSLSAKLDIEWTSDEFEALVALTNSVVVDASLNLLHYHYAVPFAAAAAAVTTRLGDRAPAVVGTLHGSDVSVLGRSPDLYPELPRVVKSADALTTVSLNHAALSRSTFRLPALPQVISNFVDTERFRPDHAARSGRRKRVVHVSNFRYIKRSVAAARIYSEIRREVDAELWLLGDGEEMPNVRRELERSGVIDDVRCLGLLPSLESVLPHNDVILVTSASESFCLSALEAAACGVPAVAPAIGGIPETVIDGVTGLLYPPGDHAAAARAVLRLLADDKRRQSMGAAAIEHAEHYATHEVVGRYELLYMQLLESMPSTAAARSS